MAAAEHRFSSSMMRLRRPAQEFALVYFRFWSELYRSSNTTKSDQGASEGSLSDDLKLYTVLLVFKSDVEAPFIASGYGTPLFTLPRK